MFARCFPRANALPPVYGAPGDAGVCLAWHNSQEQGFLLLYPVLNQSFKFLLLSCFLWRESRVGSRIPEVCGVHRETEPV